MKRGSQRGGFTLIELLVVISIISLLASMMLPSLSRAKEKARTATCLNNLHQMGISLKLYVDDANNRFPGAYVREPEGGQLKVTVQTLGGFDPIPRLTNHYPSARARVLNAYMLPSPVYKCPADKGQMMLPCESPPLKPSNWSTIGCSYQYNAGRLAVLAGGGFKRTPADPINGIADKSEDWPGSPTHYILMHEPPARLYGCPEGPEWYQWHYAQGGSDVHDPKRAPPQFWSPILFVDGHVTVFNFSHALATDPYYPYEATKDWTWYKALDDSAPIR